MEVLLAFAALVLANCVMFPAMIRLAMAPSVAKFTRQQNVQWYTQDN